MRCSSLAGAGRLPAACTMEGQNNLNSGATASPPGQEILSRAALQDAATSQTRATSFTWILRKLGYVSFSIFLFTHTLFLFRHCVSFALLIIDFIVILHVRLIRVLLKINQSNRH